VSDAFSALGDLASPWAYVVVFLLAVLETAAFVGLAVPGELGLLVGGFVVSEGRASLGVMMVLAAVGAALGDSIGYCIGRRFGPRIREGRLGAKVGERRWQRAEDALRRYGGWAVFFGRFVGILRALVPALAGASGLRYRRFLLWDALGAVIWGPGLVWLGYMAGGSYDKVAQWTGRAGLVLLGLALVMGTLLAGGRWLSRHPEEWAAWRDRMLAGPVVGQVLRLCARPVRFLGRRLRPGSALGLSLTLQLAVIGAAAWLFATVLKDVVAGDQLSTLDEPVTRYVADHREPWLTTLFRRVTFLGDLVVLVPLVGVVGLWIWRRTRSWVPLLTLSAALAGSVALYTVVRPLVGRPRPEMGPLVAEAAGFAFPSGHATQAMALYGLLAVLVSRHVRSWTRSVAVWTAAALIVVLVGFSRLYLGVNWVTDVVGGYALGALWLVAVVATTAGMRRLQRGRVPPARTERVEATDAV
jgi:membrane protein DedA with SNARE-associated domain/membrane-associated phospholipid phosphatase